MKRPVLFACLSGFLFFAQGCVSSAFMSKEPNLIAEITADKQQIRFGEEVILTIRIKNLSDRIADFSAKTELVKVKWQKEAIECSYPPCMWGLYHSRRKCIQTASSLPEFQLSPGDTYQLQNKFVLNRNSYPFPTGLYLGELRGKPNNKRKFHFRVIPANVTVME